MGLVRELAAGPQAKGGRAPAKVHGHIKDPPSGHTHELGLGMRRVLKVDAAQHAFV